MAQIDEFEKVQGIVGSHRYATGLRLLECPDGSIRLTYVHNPKYVFASPVVIENRFDKWTDAIHFLALWESLRRVSWRAVETTEITNNEQQEETTQ